LKSVYVKTSVREESPTPCSGTILRIATGDENQTLHWSGLGIGHVRRRKNAVHPHPSLRATISHKERENNKVGLWPKQTLHATPLPRCQKRLLVALKSAL